MPSQLFLLKLRVNQLCCLLSTAHYTRRHHRRSRHGLGCESGRNLINLPEECSCYLQGRLTWNGT